MKRPQAYDAHVSAFPFKAAGIGHNAIENPIAHVQVLVQGASYVLFSMLPVFNLQIRQKTRRERGEDRTII